MSNPDNDPFDLQGQDDAKAKRDEREKANRALEVEDFKWVASDKRGRRFLYRLLEKTGLFRNPFTGNSETFFRCGEMNVGQALFATLMDHAPARFAEMLEEHKCQPKR